ncbi:helix-turn-helix domain-containing protein [Amycolatopsis sp. WQ 127309]|uniref:helix-turn-helix domain-containing protein n=1 Tax=Amycolatopsis sp. WQ 127309 TaxID=2932773 RepID=UPI001FF268EB|nr:helix-turn-helix transcriptional regulator [Amycolatopsis sp. WQ 127309]UOZ07500.1 helix-turn-helix transcriptional regulator [Amycolatopsis sp. WQ 127309]
MAECERVLFEDVEAGTFVPVGVLVTRVRHLRGLTQREASDQIGIDIRALSLIETGRRTVKAVGMLISLADGLEVPRTQFLEWVTSEMEFHHTGLRGPNSE